MFDYTMSAIKKMSVDLKRGIFATSIVTQLLLLAYFGYAIYSGSGNLIANVVLAVLSAMYFVFFITTSKMTGKEEAQVKKLTARIFKYTKLFIKAMTLVATLYGAVIAMEDVAAVDIILLVLSLLGWVVQVIFEVVVLYVETQIKFIVLAFQMDMEIIKKPVTVVGDALKKIAGKPVEKHEENAPKKREKLRRLKEVFVAERKAKRAKQKATNEKAKQSDVKDVRVEGVDEQSKLEETIKK